MCLGRVLVIAGSDSGGGAGIQGDIKTITALGGFAMTAITALTAQNTESVSAIHEIPLDFLREQIKIVMSDLGADCIKIGMLHSVGVIETVAEAINDFCVGVPIVTDTVMTAKGGAKLLADDAVFALKKYIIPISTLITPNIPEAEVLSGHQIFSAADAARVGKKLLKLGPLAVLMKGGHLDNERMIDQLFLQDSSLIFEGQRLLSTNTHGTGCSLASACADGLSRGLSVKAAVERAREYVFEGIRTAPGFGKGHGPLNHSHTIRSEFVDTI